MLFLIFYYILKNESLSPKERFIHRFTNSIIYFSKHTITCLERSYYIFKYHVELSIEDIYIVIHKIIEFIADRIKAKRSKILSIKNTCYKHADQHAQKHDIYNIHQTAGSKGLGLPSGRVSVPIFRPDPD